MSCLMNFVVEISGTGIHAMRLFVIVIKSDMEMRGDVVFINCKR